MNFSASSWRMRAHMCIHTQVKICVCCVIHYVGPTKYTERMRRNMYTWNWRIWLSSSYTIYFVVFDPLPWRMEPKAKIAFARLLCSWISGWDYVWSNRCPCITFRRWQWSKGHMAGWFCLILVTFIGVLQSFAFLQHLPQSYRLLFSFF